MYQLRAPSRPERGRVGFATALAVDVLRWFRRETELISAAAVVLVAAPA